MPDMVDIGDKIVTKREATAEVVVCLSPAVLALIKKDKIPKGDVLETARLAGIMAAKKTAQIVPLCHPLPIESVRVEAGLGKDAIKITATVKAQAKTGVEMEALCACSVAALTVYDMCKGMDRGIVIKEIKLMRKTGGKSGPYVRK